jgi:hypothetical protein
MTGIYNSNTTIYATTFGRAYLNNIAESYSNSTQSCLYTGFPNKLGWFEMHTNNGTILYLDPVKQESTFTATVKPDWINLVLRILSIRAQEKKIDFSLATGTYFSLILIVIGDRLLDSELLPV